MRVRLAAAAAVACALSAVLAAPLPGASAATGPARSVPVWPGVVRQEWALATPAGDPVAAQALVVQPGSVQLRTVLARDRVPGLEDTGSMGRRMLPRGGVAGVNGGFWLSQPVGEPNSYQALSGELVSEAETQGSVMRGTFGVRDDGQPLVDRVGTAMELRGGGGTTRVDGVNRVHRGGPYPDAPDVLYLYTPHFGERIEVPSSGPAARGNATAIVLPGVSVPPAGERQSQPAHAPRTLKPGESVAIPPDGVLALAYGSTKRRLLVDAVTPDEPVTIRTTLSTVDRDRSAAWAGVTEALAAGPLIVREGRSVTPASCNPEGFEDFHCNLRSPRSAIGHTAGGGLLLVTVDGRQEDWSAGMTMAELAQFMLRLGAVEAIALDGGGSATMVVDGRVTNRPSDGQPRLVANGLFLFHDEEFAATTRLSGPVREATAAAAARAAHPEGADEVVIAAAADFPDALAGGPLAARLAAPLLLTRASTLSADTADAIADLRPRRATLLGGSQAISERVADQLRGRGIEVRRIAGPSRVETAARIATALGSGRPRAFVAWQGGFADALAAAAPAGMMDAPIVLSLSARVPPATVEALRASGAGEVVLVGGTRVLGPQVEQQLRAALPGVHVTRLSGATRFGTSRAVNEWAEGEITGLDPSGLVVAQGSTFPDALAGGPLATARRQLLAIVPPVHVGRDPDSGAYLERRQAQGLEHVTLLGGHAVLSSFQQLQLERLAGG